MQSTRLLPPQFLLPSWTPRQLVQFTQRRAYYNHENGRPSRNQPNPRHKEPHDVKKTNTSLFEELFPEDAYAKKSASRRLDKLPAFKWHVDLPPEGRGRAEFPIRRGTQMIEPGSLRSLRKTPVFKEAEERASNRRPTVLLLSALTKTLEESDFFRLSPKGKHIEGWTSGIIKVIQARDTHTLEPLGFYFILFTHLSAAQKYRDNLLRMHELSKVRGFVKKSQVPLPNQHLKEGEDIDDVLRSFSLVPPSGRLSMRILKEPFTPFIHNMVEEGIHAALNEQQGKGEATVLLVTETGRFSEVDIYDAIQTDVRRRNLAWRLAGGKKDIERLNDRVVVDDEETEELYAQETRTKSLAGQARFKSRFVIAFKDRHEARRFVREWHRMPLPLTKKNWELPIVNVQMLW